MALSESDRAPGGGANKIANAVRVSAVLVLAGRPGASGFLERRPGVPRLIGYFPPLFSPLLGDQDVHQRSSSAENPETAKRFARGLLVGVVVAVALSVPLAAFATVLPPDVDPDAVVLSLAGESLLAAAVGIIITTVNRYVLSSAGNLVYVLGRFFPSMLAIRVYPYTMYGAAIAPALVAALLPRRWRAAGGIATAAWQLPLSILAPVVAGLLTGGRSAELARESASRYPVPWEVALWKRLTGYPNCAGLWPGRGSRPPSS